MIEWWTAHDGALYGAIGGAAIGMVGACLGAAAGLLAPRGRGRGVVLGSMATMAAGGLVALGAGVIAVSGGQPYHVWYPLLLCGGILALVMGPLVPVVRARYRQAEARRMQAQELRRS